MNYRHAYHAGNFADAFKHIVLVALTQAFLQKPSAFCYLDTHAGTGCYDLFSEAAQVNKEYVLGIQKIITAENQPELIKTYLQCVWKLNPDRQLRYYPGSPFFVKNFLREQDRMVLSELHPEEYAQLKTFFSKEKNIAVHKQDAYQSLKAFLPPKERRGFVLMDPPYEQADEIKRLNQFIPEMVKHWETGTYVIWYPIKNRREELKTPTLSKPCLKLELSIYPENTPQHLNGSGMLIINPPWKLAETMGEVLPWLWKVLSMNQQGKFDIQLLH